MQSTTDIEYLDGISYSINRMNKTLLEKSIPIAMELFICIIG